MNRSTSKASIEDPVDKQIQENVANWQSSNNPLAPLKEEQTELIYELGDIISSLYSKSEADSSVKEGVDVVPTRMPVIVNNKDFIQWMVSVEKEIQHENLKSFQVYYASLSKHLRNCETLFSRSELTLNSITDLKDTYQNVTDKTNYLHNLSEQLMVQQRVLKEKKNGINARLKHFVYFSKCQEKIEQLGTAKVNSEEFIEILNNIDDALEYLGEHMNFKESNVYKMKYESLLGTALTYVYNFVNNVITETTKQIVNPDTKTDPPRILQRSDSSTDSVFSLYYGKFQSAAVKVKVILDYLEKKDNVNSYYTNALYDCQKSYFTQRLPILEVAVSKALTELKEKHKNDYSVLFRSCCLFMIKVCIDESRCYNYFFDNISSQLHDYLSSHCQYLYDTLRPCLILINHIEILSELCSILKSEMLSEKVTGDNHLPKYVEVIKQLLEDVEERLVFRANVFFNHDLNDYKPSPGDLAYPDKLQQMENIVIELKEKRSDSRASIVSMESQEVAQINTPVTHLRSYTGNSPADLHGMWYPTVKRTLVCLSRLYFCLDRDTFQGLAQEALIVCVRTVQNAADLISSRKTPIDGKLFQIKHLLIIREQIAPFQVDFTTKELALDFSTVQKAAIDLIHNRNQIFTFGSNNALLEFLLEGTPKVKEYLVDSRKEIDKQLKHSCESFIAYVTKLLIGNILQWIEQAEKVVKKNESVPAATNANESALVKQSFGRPEFVEGLIKEAQKNMKIRIPEIQRSMQLYLANRETEFILFRPIKNNIINAFMQVDQVLIKAGYSTDDQLQIACPSPEQVNILICSVSLTVEQEQMVN